MAMMMVVVLAWAKHVMRVANSQGHGGGRGARSAEAIDPLSSDGCDKGGKKNLSSGDACKTRERCWCRSSAPCARSSSRSTERAGNNYREAIFQKNVVTAMLPGLRERTRHTEWTVVDPWLIVTLWPTSALRRSSTRIHDWR